MSRTALVFDPKAHSGPPAGTREGTRRLLRRTLWAIESQFSEPRSWRLFQLTVAMSEYRYGRYDAAMALAQRAMLPREQIPPVEVAGLLAFPLSIVRNQILAL